MITKMILNANFASNANNIQENRIRQHLYSATEKKSVKTGDNAQSAVGLKGSLVNQIHNEDKKRNLESFPVP